MPYTKDDPKIYYQAVGNGTPIIFIAPPAMGHLTFHYQTLLENNYRIITFDNRGDCRSTCPDLSMTFDDLVYDVNRIMEANDIQKAVICGYSNGGLIAQQFAITFPEKSLGLMLIGGYYAPKNVLLRIEYHFGIWIAKKKAIPLLAKALSFNHFRDKKIAVKMDSEIKRTNPYLLMQQYQLGLDFSIENTLHLIKVPLLLIYGANDKYVHDYQYYFRDQLSEVDVAYVHRSKHQVPTKYFHECNAIIKEWTTRKGLLEL
ncbi:alpha/beta fold hydrolase [Gracilibacillus massiliensis]|uniref:alpha/beta fold hydrolase n=1 Tax=Gracilibacillus massiliensis TaxID=1564956 RepID=UPI00071C3C47|nr:alpha/beta hydrolase [Gracilibacillus massiliensis]